MKVIILVIIMKIIILFTDVVAAVGLVVEAVENFGYTK